MSLFGPSREHQERDIRELNHLGRPIPLAKISANLISKHEHTTNPHRKIGRELMKKTDQVIQDVIRKNQKGYPIQVRFHNHRLFIQNERSMVMLRGLRSCGKQSVYLDLVN